MRKSSGITGILCSLVVFVSLMLWGCGTTAPGGSGGNEKTVQDDYGVSLSIPVHPLRVLPLGVSTDDMVIPLVGAERIVAVSKYPPNWPEEVKKIEKRVESRSEVILSYKPDIVIMPDWYNKEFIEELRQLQLPVYVYKTPKTYEESRKLLAHLADVLSERKKGETIVKGMDERLQKLTDFVKTIPQNERKRVVFYTAHGITGGSGSTFDNLTAYAGVENGASTVGLTQADSAYREALWKINPDIIFVPSNDFDSNQYRSPEAAMLYDDPALQGLKAVQNKQIYTLNARWVMSYSQFMLAAMEEIAGYSYGYRP